MARSKRTPTPAELPRMPRFSEITQVAVVTRDRDTTVRQLHAALGAGSFKLVSIAAPQLLQTTYGDEPEDWSFRAGLTWLGGMQLEIIEPTAGRTVFDDYLRARDERPGVQHIYLDRRTGGLDDAIADLDDAGFPWQQEARMNASGRLGWMPVPALPGFLAKKHAARFGYTRSQDTLKVDLELAKFPPGVSQRLALRAAIPDAWLPEGDGRFFEKMPPDTFLGDIDGVCVLCQDLEAVVGRYGALCDRAPDVTPYADDVLPGRGRLASIGFATTTLHLVQPSSGPVAEFLASHGEGVAMLRARPATTTEAALEAAADRGWSITRASDGACAVHSEVPFTLWLPLA